MDTNSNQNCNQNCSSNTEKDTNENGGNDMLAAKPLNGTNATGLTREKKEMLAKMIDNAPSHNVDLNKVLEWWRNETRKL